MNALRKSHYFYVCSCKEKVFLLNSKLLVDKVNHMSPRWGFRVFVYPCAIDMLPLPDKSGFKATGALILQDLRKFSTRG